MFDDDNAARGEKVRGIEEIQDFKIIRRPRVRRIEKNEVGEQAARGQLREACDSIHDEDFRTRSDAEGFKILANQICGGAMILEENNFSRAAAERLNSHGASAGEAVHEEGIFNLRAENIEERFA